MDLHVTKYPKYPCEQKHYPWQWSTLNQSSQEPKVLQDQKTPKHQKAIEDTGTTYVSGDPEPQEPEDLDTRRPTGRTQHTRTGNCKQQRAQEETRTWMTQMHERNRGHQKNLVAVRPGTP